MESLPIFFKIKDRPAVVIGGGEVAARKLALLCDAGARALVVAPKLGRTLAAWVDSDKLDYRQGEFTPADLDGRVLAIAATDDREVNRAVAAAAMERNIPVNVVDDPGLCTFTVGSIIDRSPVLAAVSTGGASPVLARLLRARLESLIPATYGRLSLLAKEYRERVKQHFEQPLQRRQFWERVFQGPIAEMVFSGRDQAARDAVERALQAEVSGKPPLGEVYLVGAGPGDPDLLTFRALRLMQQADIVVHDRLVSEPVLELTRRDAERFYVGKERDNHAVPQEDINDMLVRLAKEGKRVLRLKGGDPFIFGRGGEEIETLVAEGVPFQVVPGITAASGCATYAGIPLTHRDYSQACVFVTGHLKDGTSDLNWPALAQPNQTVVFYMGLVGLAGICEQLIAHGMPATTPIAIVQKGTTPEQRVLTGTLDSFADEVKQAGVKPPTLIIVGEVVTLRDRLKWFEPQPDADIHPVTQTIARPD
jgi:uroporphyrin-III C-methyltransferase/precorrin-2 dehydrogenase/sirohydrochlorin ferrochelatase